jgi:hypothetical protein
MLMFHGCLLILVLASLSCAQLDPNTLKQAVQVIIQFRDLINSESTAVGQFVAKNLGILVQISENVEDVAKEYAAETMPGVEGALDSAEGLIQSLLGPIGL